MSSSHKSIYDSLVNSVPTIALIPPAAVAPQGVVSMPTPARKQNPTADNWVPNADGDWDTASNWSGGVPTSSNAVTINTTSVHSITHSTGNDFANSLTVGDDQFALTGGTLTILTTASFGDGLSITGGTLSAGTITITGAGTFTGGTVNGTTALDISGAAALDNFDLGGSASLSNTGTTSLTGNITVGDNTGVGASIDNEKGGLFQIGGDYTIGTSSGSATLVNAGTLAMIAGSGVGTVAIDIASTGAITAVRGSTLEFDGQNNTLAGTLGGVGQIDFNDSSYSVLTMASIGVGTLGLYGQATLALGESTSFAGTFDDSNNSSTNLDLGTYTLTLSGPALFDANFNTYITGGGTLALGGTTSFTGNGASTVFGGALTVSNTGTILQAGNVKIGDSAGDLATLTNTAKATYDLTNATNILVGANASSALNNAGLFEQTQTTGTSNVDVDFDNAAKATLDVNAGTMDFDDALLNNGTIGGAGELAIVNSATATLGATTKLTVGTFALFDSATLDVNTKVAYAGTLLDESDGTTTINLGKNTLNLSGTGNVFSGSSGDALITGTGVLAITGSATLAGNATIIGQTATLSNAGTINQTGVVIIGDSSGDVATLINAAGGVYDFTQAENLEHGSNTASAVENAGLFEATGAGQSTVTADITSTGTMSAAQGATLDVQGAENTISGTLTGAGQIAFDGGSNTTLTAASIALGTLALDGSATLNFGTSTVFSGAFIDNVGFETETAINVGSNKVTLSGPTTFTSDYSTDVFTGSGTLSLAGTTTADSALLLNGPVTASNTGTFIENNTLTIGDTSGDVATFNNAAGAVFDFTADVNINSGTNTLSVLNNAGLLEKTSTPSGTSIISASIDNTGTIAVAAGSIGFNAALTNTGTISGAGEFYLQSSASATLGAGTALTVAELGVFNSAALDLTSSLTYAGALLDESNGITSLNLNANTLTLSGTGNVFSGAFGYAGILGSGTLNVTGAATLGGMIIGATATFNNAGTINQTGFVEIGDSSGKTATVLNSAGKTWTIANGNASDSVEIGDGASPASQFENAGILASTAGTGSLGINTSFDNESSGTISIVSGGFFNEGILDNAGTITGADLALIGSSVTTLASGTSLSGLGSISLQNGANLDIGTSLSYAGAFDDDTNGTTTVNLGSNNLTLTGSAQFIGSFGVAYITGTGTLFTKGATTISSMEIGGASTYSNSGTITDQGQFYVGDSSGDTATFINAAKSVFNLLTDNNINITVTSDFDNAGLLNFTATGGNAEISGAFTNTGTIEVSGGGTLEFTAGSLHNTGTIIGTVTTDQQGDIFITK